MGIFITIHTLLASVPGSLDAVSALKRHTLPLSYILPPARESCAFGSQFYDAALFFASFFLALFPSRGWREICFTDVASGFFIVVIDVIGGGTGWVGIRIFCFGRHEFRPAWFAKDVAAGDGEEGF